MILATICARGGSKRVPGKALRMIAKYPLIDYAVHQAYDAEGIDRVIVSTEDEQIAERWIDIVQVRPAELATDTASKWDVFRHIASQNELKDDDILVDLDVGCPMRAPEDITACIRKLSGFDVVCTAYEAERNPYFNMVEIQDDSAHIVGDMKKAITRGQDAPMVYSLSPSVFAVKVRSLFLWNHWSRAKLGIVIVPRERAWDIDTEFDFEIAEFLLEKGIK